MHLNTGIKKHLLESSIVFYTTRDNCINTSKGYLIKRKF